MSILHLVRRSAFETNDFQQCIKNLLKDDALLLIDDGCYNVNHSLMNEVRQILPYDSIHLMKDHAIARAVDTKDIKNIDMKQVISMTFSFDSVVTWQ